MLYHAARAGAFSMIDGVRESLTSFRRAGKKILNGTGLLSNVFLVYFLYILT
jgi:hypothetical protein